MAYCVKCGARVDDGLKFCPYCKAEIPGAAERMDEKSPYIKSGDFCVCASYHAVGLSGVGLSR